MPDASQYEPTDDARDFIEVEVSVFATFKAYVLADPARHFGTLEEQVQHEIADAIEYRAPHLSDTEEGDALAVLSEGPSLVAKVTVLPNVPDSAFVERLIEGVSGEVF